MNLICEHVCKDIKGTRVLDDINLELEGGKVYGLWGKNGCGKTMLMRCLCGFIQPTSGRVLVEGKELWKDISFPESVGVLIENPSFLNEYTGFQNLQILASIRKQIDEKVIREMLRCVGLDPYDRRKYRKYSLGMKQHLGIACAVMESPKLIILDEPINALDESGVKLVRTLLHSMKEKGSLILIACHDKEEMQILADEIYVMAEGRIELNRPSSSL